MFQIKLVLLNLILWFSLLPEAIRYGIAVLFPVRAQQKVLEEILAKMSMSMEVFHHHTLTHYEDYEDQIETLRRTGIHPTYHEEVLRLCPTSGTGGKNKLIPYTASLKAAFQKGVYPWIFFLYLRFPQLFFSRQYWSVTPIVMTEKGWGESRVQIGFEKDEDYAGYFQKLIMKTVWVDAAKVATDCPDARTFLGKLAGMLSQETNLGLISVWSPSLLAILVAQHGASLPHDLILSSWAHGSSKDESLRIAESLHATIQPKGLFSTEACTTISIGTRTFFPAYNSHYFEFRNLSSGTLEKVTTLKVGQEYEVVVTTQSGFIRYATSDVIRVTKLVCNRPSCEFVGRLGVIDLFGEKLDEVTVEQCVTELLDGKGDAGSFWFLAPVRDSNGLVSYTLFATLDMLEDSLQKSLDSLLRNSYHYNYCRELGQLGEAKIFVITNASPELQFIETTSSGLSAPLGGIKIGRISRREDWHTVFEGSFV